jgi:hypothetical protein
VECEKAGTAQASEELRGPHAFLGRTLHPWGDVWRKRGEMKLGAISAIEKIESCLTAAP